jgi:hypothetical protein
MYTYGTDGSDACPAGSRLIATETACIDAASAAQNKFAVTENDGTRPKGCYVAISNGQVRFNQHATGSAAAGAVPLCIVVTCKCLTPWAGAVGSNGITCTDNTTDWCGPTEMCLSYARWNIGAARSQYCGAACWCKSPNKGTAGLNGYQCTDTNMTDKAGNLVEGYCASWDACYNDKKWSKGSATNKYCRDPTGATWTEAFNVRRVVIGQMTSCSFSPVTNWDVVEAAFQNGSAFRYVLDGKDVAYYSRKTPMAGPNYKLSAYTLMLLDFRTDIAGNQVCCMSRFQRVVHTSK